jgi:hypothetical protein
MADPQGRRKSDGSGASRPSEPAVQIRGFHVEGQPQPQQLSPSVLLGSKVTAGSPTPVLIPPSFQVKLSLARAPTSVHPAT